MQGFSRALQERDHALHSEEKVVVVGDEKREEKIREVDAGADALGVDDEEDAGTESPEVVDSDLITITINVTSSEALNSARADLDAATTATTAAMEVAKEAKEREHAAHRELGRLGGELADVVEQLASKTSESMVLADRLAVASHSLTLAEEQMGVLTQRIGERDSELQAANTDNARLRKMREASKEKDAEAKDLRGKLQEQSKLAKKHKADADKQGKVVKKLQEKAKEAKNCEVRAPDVAADGSDGTLVIHRSSVSSEIGSKEGLKYVPLTATARLQLAQRKDALHAEREAREVESKEHAATVVDLQAKNVQLSSELTSLSEQVRKVMAVLEQAQQLEVQNRYLKQELVDLRSDTVMALQLVQRVREMQGGATASQPGTFITHGPAST
jgi:chromosome segregation ATPase